MLDRLESMRVFVAVAEERGFAAAARRLGLSPPAVTRAVAALEQRLGARLLHRSTRVVRPSDAGLRFLADCKRILAEVAEAEAAAAGAPGALAGPLAITAPVMFGRLHLAPVLLDFLTRHPQVSARLLLLDRVTDLLEEGLDVALRIAALPDSSLSALRVGSVRQVVCAAPGYLAARGRPQRPADLQRFEAVGFSAGDSEPEWAFALGGRTEKVRPRTPLRVNSAEVAIAAALAGRGLARVLSYQIFPELRDGRLELVLTDFEPPPLPVHLVHAEGRRAGARLRAFLDFAGARLRATEALGP